MECILRAGIVVMIPLLYYLKNESDGVTGMMFPNRDKVMLTFIFPLLVVIVSLFTCSEKICTKYHRGFIVFIFIYLIGIFSYTMIKANSDISKREKRSTEIKEILKSNGFHNVSKVLVTEEKKASVVIIIKEKSCNDFYGLETQIKDLLSSKCDYVKYITIKEN